MKEKYGFPYGRGGERFKPNLCRVQKKKQILAKKGVKYGSAN